MLVLQEKVFTLLQEIDEICKKNNIVYYLGPTTLHLAKCGGFRGNIINLDILMTTNNLAKFIDVVSKEGRKDRALDYTENYSKHLWFGAEYVDKSTTFIKLDQGEDVSCYGAKVYIFPIRKVITGFKSKWYTVLELGWEFNRFRVGKRIHKKNFTAGVIVRILLTIMGEKRFANYLYHNMLNVYDYDENMEEICIKRFARKKQRYSSKYFNGTSTVLFEGKEFLGPMYEDEFLVDFYGEIDEDREFEYDFENYIVLENVSYEEYLQEIEKRGYSLIHYFRKRTKNRVDKIFVTKSMRLRNQAVLIAKRSGDRLKYYEQFEKQKEIIQNLYLRKDFENLSEIFAEHEAKTLYYLKNGLGFCIGKEYFDIQCEILKYKDKEDIVNKLIGLIPEEHYSPII